MGNACYTVCATLTCNLERQKNVPLWQLVKCIAFEVTIIGVMFAVTLVSLVCRRVARGRILVQELGRPGPSTLCVHRGLRLLTSPYIGCSEHRCYHLQVHELCEDAC